MPHRIAPVLIAVIVATGQGCATSMRNQSLQSVARGWCMVIRASQVIPVYPLTEDVQPGDVFLVQVPYETQIKVYQSRGFLPLENLVTRIYPEGYFDFYRGRYGIQNAGAFPPGMWQFPPPAGTPVDYAMAPRAAFPTYGFTVSRSEGLNAAAPVQGIPVGLNLLNSASADGQAAASAMRCLLFSMVTMGSWGEGGMCLGTGSGCSRAQRAPGRHPRPRGTEQSPMRAPISSPAFAGEGDRA